MHSFVNLSFFKEIFEIFFKNSVHFFKTILIHSINPLIHNLTYLLVHVHFMIRFLKQVDNFRQIIS